MKPKLLYSILLFLFILSGEYLSAQAQKSRYNFKHLTTQNGLAQNIVYHFLQDSHGSMWLGTRNGLTLYDGTRTTNFLHDEETEKTIGSNFITRLLEDSLHQMWIGTDVGVSRYNRSNSSFSNFSIVKENGEKEPTFCVPLGFANDHEMWLLETKTKSIKIFNTQTEVTDSLTASPAVDGVLWHSPGSPIHHIWTYLGSGTIHYVFAKKKLIKKETFFTGDVKNGREPLFQVLHVLPQNDSLVWLSTPEGLIELNPLTRRYHLHKTWGTQLVNELRYTAMAPDGILWMGTGNNGVYTFNLKTKSFIDNYRHYRLDPFSIGSNNIVSLYFDRVGNVWCGSYGQGISYAAVEARCFQKALSRNEFDKWEGNNNVYWIGYDKGANLWCMMNGVGGLWKLDSDRKILQYREPLLESGKFFTGRFYKLLFDGDRYAWCIGKEGLFQYNLLTNRLHKMTYTFFSHDLFGSNWVQDMIRLKDGSFLFCTFSGLYRMTSKAGGYDIQPFSSLNKKAFISFAALFQDDVGNIYVKDKGDGFYVLETSKGTWPDSLVHSIPFPPQVAQFHTDTVNNAILLATNSGLYQLNRKDFSLKKVIFKIPPRF